MSYTSRITVDFERIKRARRVNGLSTISAVGHLAKDTVAYAQSNLASTSIAWAGPDSRQSEVLTLGGKWSRPLNTDLLIRDPRAFGAAWDKFERGVVASAGTGFLSGMTPYEVNTVCYTATALFAACVDLFKPSQATPGVFLELLTGASVAVLSGRPETGDVLLVLPGGLGAETVKVDLTFVQQAGVSLAVPTKTSTRERVSQPYVHARILEAAQPGRWRTVLCVVNESNATWLHPSGSKTVSNLAVKETLVPKTIVLYQKYVASLAGIYYMDPPPSYLGGKIPGMPPVATYGEFLTRDLGTLL